MRFCVILRRSEFRFNPAAIRTASACLLLAALASCASQGAGEAEMAAEQARSEITEQAAMARQAQEQERVRAAELQTQRQQQAEQRARLQEERVQAQAQVEAQARADEQQRQREDVERQERERIAAIVAAAERERQTKLDRITELEQQIAAVRSASAGDEADIEILAEAILVAEELLELLALEQAKYDDMDEQGNTQQPLAKDLIAEIEARKDALLSQISSQ